MRQAERRELTTASFILGIVAICTVFIPVINLISWIMGILAVIFGIIGFCNRANIGKAIIAIFLGIFTIMITFNSINKLNNEMGKMTGNQTSKILEKEVNIEIGNYEIDKNNRGSLPVKITNKTSKMKSFTIEIEVVKANGERVTETQIFVSDLRPGQTKNTSTFNSLNKEETEKFRNGIFRIIKVSSY